MGDVRTLTWKHILELSREMRVLADGEEWEQLLEKETERRVAIGVFFAQPVSVEQAPGVAAGIKDLMEMDKEMLSLFVVAREHVVGKMGTMKTGRRMDSAYSAHG